MKTGVWLAFLAVTGVAGCSGGNGTGGTSEPGVDFTCQRRDRAGTYLVQWTETNGDCGPVDDTLGRLSGERETSFATPSGATQCGLTEPPTTQDQGCTITNVGACSTVDGYVLEVVAITTQEDPASNVISGTFDVTIRDQVGGAVLCSSLYDVVYRRQ